MIENSMIYNGCHVDGTVRNSILFPGVRVERGAEVNDSVLFYKTNIQHGARLNRTVSDVNTTFGAGARVGRPKEDESDSGITVIGWNNIVPEGMTIGRGCTVYPKLDAQKWTELILSDGEVLR